MTLPAPATKAHLKRVIKALEECGHRIAGVRQDGALIVEKADTAVPVLPHDMHSDPYVIAASGVRNAEKTRKRRGRFA